MVGSLLQPFQMVWSSPSSMNSLPFRAALARYCRDPASSPRRRAVSVWGREHVHTLQPQQFADRPVVVFDRPVFVLRITVEDARQQLAITLLFDDPAEVVDHSDDDLVMAFKIVHHGARLGWIAPGPGSCLDPFSKSGHANRVKSQLVIVPGLSQTSDIIAVFLFQVVDQCQPHRFRDIGCGGPVRTEVVSVPVKMLSPRTTRHMDPHELLSVVGVEQLATTFR